MRRLLTALTALALAAGAASAFPVQIQGDYANRPPDLGDGTGRFVGTLDYNYVSGTSATFTVNLTNTTAPGGHYLTGFAFNSPRDSAGQRLLTNSTLTSKTDSDFLQLGYKNVDVDPFGTMDSGAALKADWLGGGNPNNGLPPGGIAAGSSGSFVFTVTGSAADLASLTTWDFINTQSVGGSHSTFFAVRFRGGTNPGDDSDKVSGLAVTPEPSSFVLLGVMAVGLAGAHFTMRRRRLALAVAV